MSLYRELSRPFRRQEQERKNGNVPLQQNICPLIVVDWEAAFFTFARLDFSDISATAALSAPGASCCATNGSRAGGWVRRNITENSHAPAGGRKRIEKWKCSTSAKHLSSNRGRFCRGAGRTGASLEKVRPMPRFRLLTFLGSFELRLVAGSKK